MQEVMQKRLAIVVMMVMTALKISLAVGFLLKNDILQISFLISLINDYSIIKDQNPYKRKWALPKGREFYFFENSPVPS